jgi:hypothetical protein
MIEHSLPDDSPVGVNPPSPSHRTRSEHFIMMPLSWAKAACEAGSAALCVGALLWYRHKVRQESTIVLSNLAMEPLGVGRKRKTLGLNQLSAAGLISITSRTGTSPRVTINHPPLRALSTGSNLHSNDKR